MKKVVFKKLFDYIAVISGCMCAALAMKNHLTGGADYLTWLCCIAAILIIITRMQDNERMIFSGANKAIIHHILAFKNYYNIPMKEGEKKDFEQFEEIEHIDVEKIEQSMK